MAHDKLLKFFNRSKALIEMRIYIYGLQLTPRLICKIFIFPLDQHTPFEVEAFFIMDNKKVHNALFPYLRGVRDLN